MEARLLTTKEAAQLLGISEVSLECGRCRQSPGFPAYVRIRRSIRYDVRVLEKYIQDHSIEHGVVNA